MDVRWDTIVADHSKKGCIGIISNLFHHELEHVDILVNNGGLGSIVSSFEPKPVVAFDDCVWDMKTTSNLTVPYMLCKAFLFGMLERKYGRIIR